MSHAELPLASPEAAPPPPPPPLPRAPELRARGALARIAEWLTAWSERWVPDAFVFALAATLLVLIAATVSGKASAAHAIELWGDGFWELIPFTLQMALVIVTGYVVATSRPVYRLIATIAGAPTSPRVAVAMIALFAMTSSWLNWGFSLIFSAMLAREVARRVPGVDYRAAAASSFMGLGSVWAQGLSGSAALLMASPGAAPASLREVVAAGGTVANGIIPLTKTIFLWQSLASVAVEIVVVTAVMYAACPRADRAVTAEAMGIDLGRSPLDEPAPVRRGVPGDYFEHSRMLSVGFVLAAFTYLVLYFRAPGRGLESLTLNVVNFALLAAGFALHGTPARLARAFRAATAGVWGVLLQFPLYAGVAAVITKTGLNEAMAGAFVGLCTKHTFPAAVAIYSAALGVLVPSGGTKWVIEAPYVLRAAHELGANLGWTVAVYDLGEALANLVQPFWMLPVLGLLGLRARDVMGYTLLVFFALAPIVLVLVMVLATTLSYPL